MHKLKRGIALLIAVSVFFALTVSGCGKKEDQGSQQSSSVQATKQETTQEETKLEPVDLTYYVFWLGPDKELPEVNDAMNKILKVKINATITIKPIAFADYDTKMNVINSSGDYYDMAFTAYWYNNYYTNVSNQNLLALDDLLPQYAPDLWKIVPSTCWDSTRVNGKIYGAINYQISVDTVGMEWNMDFMKMVEEKTGFVLDVSKYKTLQDMEPVLEAIKKANIPSTDTYPVSSNGNQFASSPIFQGYDSIGDNALPGWVKLDDASMKVVNQYETQEYKDYLKLIRKWFQEGYIRKDAAIAKSDDGKYKYRGPFATFTKPGQDEGLKETRGYNVSTPIIREPVVTTNRASATMTGVSSHSKNPERALMYLNLMASDEKLFNTLTLGIEDKHYVKTGEKTVDYANGYDAQTSPYNPQIGWAFGNQFLEWTKPGIPVDVWEQTDKLNKTAKTSPILGYSFNPDPIKTEIASCQAALGEFISSLDTGTVDPEVYLPKLLDKLKAAGVDTIIAEKQRQIDEWKATKKQ